VLFGLPMRPAPRHAYFLELLLAHACTWRCCACRPRSRVGAGAPARPLSARELEIVGWVREGKSNDEIGADPRHQRA
jgi:ATP/maltotriose-dependent transcriptional regulator MalT